MTTDINELVKRLRTFKHRDANAAAAALEAMAGARAECERQYQAKVEDVVAQMNRAEAAEAEVERLKLIIGSAAREHIASMNMVTAERDRLKAALVKIAEGDYERSGRNYYINRLRPSKNDTCGHSKAYWDDCGNCCSHFARKALGGDA